MNQEIESILRSFDEKLRSNHITKTHNCQNEITLYYYQLLEHIVKDYESYRSYFPILLNSLEENDAKSYSISIYFEMYEKIFSYLDISKIDIRQYDEKICKETSLKLFSHFDKCISGKNQIRISEFRLNVDNFTENEIKECVSCFVDIIQFHSETIEWSEEQFETHLIMLAVIKSLLKSIGNDEYFYFIVSMFLDRLNTSEYFQAARDVAEEIIIASFNDGMPELGFLNSFHCYSRQKSINAAILYGNITLFILLTRKDPLKNKLAQEIISESIKYYRNVKLYPFAIKIYKNIPSKVHFSEYERRAIDHLYFSSLLPTNDKSLPALILDYLHKEREGILRAGAKEAHPWLLILVNIKRLFSNADFSDTGLGFYLKTFDHIVPKENSSKYIEIINGNTNDLKKYLKMSLIKLNETRSKEDLVHDNDLALTIANRLIENSFKNKDDEAILLAMIIKSDFSLIFQSKKSSLFRPFLLPNNDLEKFNDLYGNHQEIIGEFSSSHSELTAWLAVSEGKLFQLSLINGKFEYSALHSFDWNVFTELKKNNYFPSLCFRDEIKDKFGIREVTPGEHLENTKEIKSTLTFGKLYSTEKSSAIQIVKDMELAKFPHNLFIDQSGNFIHAEKPITNILSTEWFMRNKDDFELKKEFSRSIWIPTEDGDITINKLFSDLESLLIEQNFCIYKGLNISTPITSDLNIICSHGSQDIASNQVIFSGQHYVQKTEHIVGKGKVLIFFVCHSGSYNNDYFKNNITSMVKNYISIGYKAVIAPFWSLHVNIPKIWLENFIIKINEGLTISNSVYQANMSVKKVYPTPAAWACMHLYGNPNLAIKN